MSAILEPLAVYRVECDAVRERRHLATRAARDLVDWSAYLAAEEKADRTQVDYLRTAAKFVIWRDKELGDYTDGDVNEFRLLFPPKAWRHYRYHLVSLFKWAKMTRRISENPMDYVPKPRKMERKVVKVWSDAEVEILCNTDPLYRILFGTGIRKGEAANLQRRHINLSDAELVVYKGKGSKDRVVPMTSRAVAVIADLDLTEGLDRTPDAFIWGCRPGGSERVSRKTRVSDATMDRWFWRTRDAAGVARHNFHVTRHTYATRYLRVPGTRLERLSEIMGHTSIQVTKDLYGHLDMRDLREDVALLEAAGF